MADVKSEGRFHFLYRQSEGTIDRRTWARASLLPLGAALALTAVAFWIAPEKPRDLNTEAFVSMAVVARQVYLIAYAFMLIICLIAEYFLSAKRFRDRALPEALAGVAPFAVLLLGAANWYQPVSEGVMSRPALYVVDALAAAAILWSVIELGIGRSHPDRV